MNEIHPKGNEPVTSAGGQVMGRAGCGVDARNSTTQGAAPASATASPPSAVTGPPIAGSSADPAATQPRSAPAFLTFEGVNNAEVVEPITVWRVTHDPPLTPAEVAQLYPELLAGDATV